MTTRETQATRFAAALLLPMEEFCKIWKRYKGHIGLIAGYFDVPEEFVHIRAKYVNCDEKTGGYD
jgi:Zn-dependent peptidase ImmA (M78 family)